MMGDRAEVGFLVRRMRLVFQGHLLGPDVRYYVQLGFSPREPDLLIPVRDAQLAWTGVRDLNVRVGQMKVPFNRERVISSSSLGMVDRSNVNLELNLDRDIGVMLQSRDLFGLGERLRYNLQSEVLFRRSAQTELRRTNDDGTATIVEHPRSAWGWMLQAGLMLSEPIEPALRYGEVRPLDRSNAQLQRDREIGGGASYHFHRHDLKVQADYFRLLREDADATAVLARDRVRVQAQFFF